MKDSTNQARREFYAAAFAAFQQGWLERRRAQCRAERWREINQVTPFGPIRLPVRVVRSRRDGRDLTLSRLPGPKATRLPLATTRKSALEAVTPGNREGIGQRAFAPRRLAPLARTQTCSGARRQRSA
jgi:hypothetical protein